MNTDRMLQLLMEQGQEIMTLTNHRLGIGKDQHPANTEEALKQILKLDLLNKTMNLFYQYSMLLNDKEVIEVFRASCDAAELLLDKMREMIEKDKK